MDHDNTFYDSLGGSARLKHAGLEALVLFGCAARSHTGIGQEKQTTYISSR